jgi:hypothetical protein
LPSDINVGCSLVQGWGQCVCSSLYAKLAGVYHCAVCVSSFQQSFCIVLRALQACWLPQADCCSMALSCRALFVRLIPAKIVRSILHSTHQECPSPVVVLSVHNTHKLATALCFLLTFCLALMKKCMQGRCCGHAAPRASGYCLSPSCQWHSLVARPQHSGRATEAESLQQQSLFSSRAGG